jgi:hypothetical protein
VLVHQAALHGLREIGVRGGYRDQPGPGQAELQTILEVTERSLESKWVKHPEGAPKG